MNKLTVLNLIEHMKKNNLDFENVSFSSKGHQSLHVYMYKRYENP